MQYAGKLVHTVTVDDIGKLHLPVSPCQCCGQKIGPPIVVSSVLGRVMAIDVGKRIYRVDGVYQVENQEQLNRRLTR